MKYKKLCVLLSVLITLTCACSTQNIKTDDNNTLTIVTTIFPAYDFTRQLVRDKADVHMLIKPGSEAHAYEPTPDDIQRINNCDLFVYVGGESDSWLDAVLETIDNPNMQIIKMMDYVNNIEEEYTIGMQIRENGHGHTHSNINEHQFNHDLHHHEYDEHVWTSPVNAISIVQAIADAVISIDSANKDFYIKNNIDYKKQLNNLNSAIAEVVAKSKRQTLVFGDRFPLLHFVREYNIDYYAAYPGCAAESEPNAVTVAFLIETVKSQNIPIVFHMEMANEKMCDTICEETGAKKAVFYSCHNVTAEQFKQGATYIDLMTKNLKALETALN